MQTPDIQPDDYTINDVRNGYYIPALDDTFTNFDDCIEAITETMIENQFWPNVWFINDHGNTDLLSVNTETGEYHTIESWV